MVTISKSQQLKTGNMVLMPVVHGLAERANNRHLHSRSRASGGAMIWNTASLVAGEKSWGNAQWLLGTPSVAMCIASPMFHWAKQVARPRPTAQVQRSTVSLCAPKDRGGLFVNSCNYYHLVRKALQESRA